jgi:copper transport protein
MQTDLPLLQAIALGSIRTVLVQSHYGLWWIVRILSTVGLLILSVWAWVIPHRLSKANGTPVAWPGVPVRVAAFILAAVILASIPVTGHAGALSEGTALAIFSDWLHLAATAVWVGGLVCLLCVLSSLRRTDSEQSDFLAALARRFSWQARVCVAFLLATGAYNAWLHMPDWSSFVSTSYGLTLLGKLLLMILLLAAAFANLRWVVPALASDGSSPGARNASPRLRMLVRAETVLAGMILIAAAALTHLPPASAVSPSALGAQTKRSGGFEVGFQMTPQRVGPNRVSARLRSADGSPIPLARRVTFYFRMLDMDMGLQTIPAEAAPDGSYSADFLLPMAGRWQVSVEISPSQGDTFVTEFQILSAPQ